MVLGRALKTLRRPFAPLTRPSARRPFCFFFFFFCFFRAWVDGGGQGYHSVFISSPCAELTQCLRAASAKNLGTELGTFIKLHMQLCEKTISKHLPLCLRDNSKNLTRRLRNLSAPQLSLTHDLRMTYASLARTRVFKDCS